MAFTTVIFDLDSTLIDHDYRNECYTFAEYFGFPYSDSFEKAFHKALHDMRHTFWDKKITRKNLAMYFSNQISELRCNGISGEEFIRAIEICTINIRNYEIDEILYRLKQHDIRLLVLTDWFFKHQAKVLIEFGYMDYFERLYTFDEYYAKPDPRAILRCIEKYDKKECLMVGDNLTSDVLCAKNAKVASVWYNPEQTKNTTLITPSFEIKSMLELVDIVI